jgi:hypothetical protein
MFDLFEADARFLYIDGVIKDEYYYEKGFQKILTQNPEFVFGNSPDKVFQIKYIVKRLDFKAYGNRRKEGYSRESLLVIAKYAKMDWEASSPYMKTWSFSNLVNNEFKTLFGGRDPDFLSDFILGNPKVLFVGIVGKITKDSFKKSVIKKLMEKNPTKMLRDVSDEIINAVKGIIFFSFTDAVKIGVKSDGLSLKYLSNKLKNNKKIVEAAVLNNPAAIKYASERLRKNKKFIRKLAKKNPNVKNYVTVSSLTSYQNEYYVSDYGYGSDDDDDDEGYF